MPYTVVVRSEITPAQREQAIALLRAYESSLGISLCFQGFAAELARFPADYRPPSGALALALEVDGETLVGLVGVRRLDPVTAEMKRLFVQPAARGNGLGRRLAEAAMQAARDLGYRRLRLDTLASMREANALYRSLAFREIGNYNATPIEGVRFFERDL